MLKMFSSSAAKRCTFWVVRSIVGHPGSSGRNQLNIAVRTVTSSVSFSSSRNQCRLCFCQHQQYKPSVPTLCSNFIRSLSVSEPLLKKGKRIAASEEEEEVEEEKGATEEGGPKDYQDVTILVQSNRLDNVIKDAAVMQRGKVEDVFYNGKVRVNSVLPPKKSVEVRENDVIDVILRPNAQNDKFTDVYRFIIQSIQSETTHRGRIAMKIRRWKQLTVDEYK